MIKDPRTADTVDSAPIVLAAQAGDSEAFGELYRLYVDMVFRFCYYRVATRHTAEDLTADTFVRALRRITTYEDQGRDFGAWLVTIARNIVNDHFKCGRTRLETVTAEMLDSDEREAAVDAVVFADMTATAVRAAVARLNDVQRECLTLRFLDGLSIAETAAAMSKNEGAIKTLQYRAVKTLQRTTRTGELV